MAPFNLQTSEGGGWGGGGGERKIGKTLLIKVDFQREYRKKFNVYVFLENLKCI